MPPFDHLRQRLQRSKKLPHRSSTVPEPEVTSPAGLHDPRARSLDVTLASLNLGTGSGLHRAVKDASLIPTTQSANIHSSLAVPVTLPTDNRNSDAPIHALGLRAPPDPSSTTVVSQSANKSSKITTWSGFKLCLGLLKESTDAFGPLKSALGEFSRCIEIFDRMAQIQKDYELLRSELDTLFGDLYRLWSGPVPPAITPMLNILAKGIIKETELVVQKHSRNMVERAAESKEDENEVLECYPRVQRPLQRVAMNVDFDTWKIVDKLVMDSYLKDLSPSQSAWYDSGKSNVPLRSGCTPKTRVGVLKTLQDWAGNKQSRGIFWLNGMAGTGKTTIAYSLCERLQSTGKLAASFFCLRQVPECKAVDLIIPTIAYQLAILSHPFKYALSRAIEQDPKAHTLKLEQQFKKLIVEPLQQVEHTMPDDLVVVIDALDECENKDRVSHMLKILLSQTPSPSAKSGELNLG